MENIKQAKGNECNEYKSVGLNLVKSSCTDIHQFGYMTQLKRIPWNQWPLEIKFNTCHIGYNH
jgi:hypothetical protein